MIMIIAIMYNSLAPIFSQNLFMTRKDDQLISIYLKFFFFY